MRRGEVHVNAKQIGKPVLVTDPILYRLACTYAALGRTTVTVQVFRDSDEADLWLAGETSAGT